MALSPSRSARASLLTRGTEGAWRPALGWLYERYNEYFEPRSNLAGSLWGGHVCGSCHVSFEEAKAMTDLGLKWHEVHEHFPQYGNYHPEGITAGGFSMQNQSRCPPALAGACSAARPVRL